MKGSINIVLGVLLIFVIGCETAYYEESYSFKNRVWQYDDPRSFSFDIVDTSQVYDLILTVDHSDQFPYQNLYVKTSTRFPSDTIIEQSLSLEMANEAGFWFGECKGPNCRLSIPIQSQVHFVESGSYTLELEQYTRTDSLIGMKAIGLKVSVVK